MVMDCQRHPAAPVLELLTVTAVRSRNDVFLLLFAGTKRRLLVLGATRTEIIS